MIKEVAIEVNRLSSRLRLLQKDLHDRSPQVRIQIYEDEIRRVLQENPELPADEFIQELSAHFPSISDLGVNLDVPQNKEMSAIELVNALKTKVAVIGEGEKESLKQDLLALGLDLIPADQISSTAEPESAPQPSSSMNANSPIVGSVDTINQQLWTVLRDISSYATHGSISSDKRCDMDAVKYLLEKGGKENEIQDELEKLKRLFGVLIHTVNNFSEAFYDEYMKSLEPDVISDSISSNGFFKSKEVKLWEHYCYLAQKTLSREAFKANVKTSMANTIINLKW
ncbi:MAG: hypothetical protein NE330_22420 [Lentisphaeraceae bacterium]|nr:hypothetical protein [Lentisphaeraceae bacterium]